MTEVAQWGDRFSEYLIQVRGVSPFTRNNYVRYARRLMEALKPVGPPDWNALDGDLICSFVQRETSKLNPTSCTQAVTAVRSFLRFLEAAGQVQPNLARAISRDWPRNSLKRGGRKERSKAVAGACKVAW
jgi:site-specific recombinase XerC